ncbi:MCE family protein [Mycolicibacterium cosmeticum]|uniref:MCE family protein n=1 Tax=Mycolicibacterium cosmeticum TaxID=258533 RepID=UPI0032048A71
MNHSRRRRVIAVITTTAVLAAAIGTAGRYVRSVSETITVTAQFDNVAGLYEDNVVAVLGIPVGRVTRITPRSGYVEVEFTVDAAVQVPADVQAVTISTSILTDRQIELTPPYRGGAVLRNHDTIGLPRTKTPVAFDRVVDMLDKIAVSLRGDGSGGGPLAHLIAAGAAATDGNGEKITSALDELANALRLSSDGGAQTAGQLTTVIRDLSSLMQAATRNDALLRQFGTTTHQLTTMLADEDFGTGSTGRKINEIVTQAADLIEKNRDHIKQSVLNGDTAMTTLVDRQREVSELLDVLPLTLENVYNAIDQTNGAVRVHALTDKIMTESQLPKEICNLMHLRQLGCSTGTLQDYGPDFGLTYVLDGLAAMGQK